MFVNVFATNKYLKIHLHWKTHLFGKEHASAIGSTTKIRRVLLENPTFKSEKPSSPGGKWTLERTRLVETGLLQRTTFSRYLVEISPALWIVEAKGSTVSSENLPC